MSAKRTALLIDGPLKHQHHHVDDPPVDLIAAEAIPTGNDRLEPIPPSGMFSEAPFERHPYRLIGVDRTYAPAPNADHLLPVYRFAPEEERRIL